MSGELKLNLNAKAFVPKKSYQNTNQQNMPNQYMGYDNMNNNQFGGYYPNQYGMPMQQLNILIHNSNNQIPNHNLNLKILLNKMMMLVLLD